MRFSAESGSSWTPAGCTLARIDEATAFAVAFVVYGNEFLANRLGTDRRPGLNPAQPVECILQLQHSETYQISDERHG